MKRILVLSLALLPAIALAHPGSITTDPTAITTPAPDAEIVTADQAVTAPSVALDVERAPTTAAAFPISITRASAQKGNSAMSQQTPSIGRIVHYRLSKQDEEAIARRRTTSSSIAERIPQGKWPVGAQAHVGNPAIAGATVPLIISAVWPDEYGEGKPGVNGQAILDGSDQLWVTSAAEGTEPGTWSWPPRA